MQGTSTNSDDTGGEWSCVGKKGKLSTLGGSSSQIGSNTSTGSGSKKGKKGSMKNARTLSLQAFYEEHGYSNDISLHDPMGAENVGIGIGR